MSSNIQNRIQKNTLLLAGAVVLFGFMPYVLFADSTNVSNSVSVSANGNGTTHASVKTVVNGEVVEDISLDEPGTLRSSYTSSESHTDINASNTITTDNTERDREILALIEKLMALIDHYVSLLNNMS